MNMEDRTYEYKWSKAYLSFLKKHTCNLNLLRDYCVMVCGIRGKNLGFFLLLIYVFCSKKVVITYDRGSSVRNGPIGIPSHKRQGGGLREGGGGVGSWEELQASKSCTHFQEHLEAWMKHIGMHACRHHILRLVCLLPECCCLFQSSHSALASDTQRI